MKYALGVDVGGTNIRMAVVSDEGEIVRVIKKRTTPTKNPKELVDQIAKLYEEIEPNDFAIEGMGIGVPGPVIQETGYVHFLSNLGIEDFNLKELVEERLNLKVTVGNDANLAGFAEAMVGHGKGHRVVQYMTISTGIGGGLIVDGRVISGSTGFAQEIGNMIIDPFSNKKQNDQMAKGSFESICSGTAIVKSAKEQGLEIEHAGKLFELALNGNEIAKKIKKEWLLYMGVALSSMFAYIEPDVFVLGGGVMKSSHLFLNELREEIDKHVFPKLRGKVKVEIAQFDQDAGIIGAALICFSR
jgi:glucokinase